MPTINRESLRPSSVRRDYQFSQNHIKSYLTPATSLNDDSSLYPDPTLDPALNNADDVLEDLYSTSDIDTPNPIPTPQSYSTSSYSETVSVQPSDSVSQTLPLIRPQSQVASRSWVYQHYTTTVLDKQYYPKGSSKPQRDKLRICKYCKGDSYRVYDSKRAGTSGMITHQWIKHKVTKEHVPIHLLDMASPSLPVSIADLITKPLPPKKPKLSPEDSIVLWIADTLLPFVSIERLSFRNMIEAHGGTSSIRCGDTVKNQMMKKADILYADLQTELDINCSTISLTWDGWTSKQQNIPILAVIGHWISPDFVAHSAILEYQRLRGVHSGENMADVIYNMVYNLNLKHKLLAMTGDSASNNCTLVEHLYNRLLKEFDEETDSELGNSKPLMRFRGQKSYIRCLAHALNRVAKDILDDLKSGSMDDTRHDRIDVSNAGPVAKLRYIIVWVGRTSQRTEKWQEHSPQKQIHYDVDIRWNSTHDMIGDALRCKPAVVQIVKDYASDLRLWALGSTDWIFLTQLFAVLSPFNEYTKHVSENRPTINTILGVYYELVELFDKPTCSNDEWYQYDERIIKAIKAGKEKFEKYGKIITDTVIYYIASVLDPRIKCTTIQAGDKDPDAKIQLVRETLHKLYPKKPGTSNSDAMDLLATKSTSELRWLQKAHQDATPISEIDRYLDGPLVDWNGSDDPSWLLQWWKGNARQYPIMSQVARDYLAIPPAEVDCERLFSSSRDLLGLRRHSMTPETMKGVLFVRDEYRRNII